MEFSHFFKVVLFSVMISFVAVCAAAYVIDKSISEGENCFTKLRHDILNYCYIMSGVDIVLSLLIISVTELKDTLSELSVIFTIFGISFVGFGKALLGRGFCHSKNMLDGQRYLFRFGQNLDRSLQGLNAVSSSFGFTLIAVLMIGVTIFVTVSIGAFCFCLGLYWCTMIVSLNSLWKSNRKAALKFFMLCIGMSVFLGMTWWINSNKISINLYLTVSVVYVVVLLAIAFGYWNLLKGLQFSQIVGSLSVLYPSSGDEPMYFKIVLKNGNILNSKKEFFYPFTCRKSILLIKYLNGNVKVLYSEQVEKFQVAGVRRVNSKRRLSVFGRYVEFALQDFYWDSVKKEWVGGDASIGKQVRIKKFK